MLENELETHVKLFEKELTRYLSDGTPRQLYDAAKHLPYGGGKRLRPVITMLACESIIDDPAKALPYAMSLELLHNFTLVHDDIMDKSTLRRNLQTVHIKYGEPTAILAGDFLFAKSFEAMHSLNVPPEVFKQLNLELIQCIEEICEGQQLDMEFESKSVITEEQYLHMIQKKTAVLFQLAARAGALIAHGTQPQIDALTTYGLNLGLAFQIWDDYLDLSSDPETLGKDIGNDIRNGKKTLIAVHALTHAPTDRHEKLTKILGNLKATDDDIKQTLALFHEIKSVEYAKKTAITFANTAQKTLDILPNSAAKTTLSQLAGYAIQRDK